MSQCNSKLTWDAKQVKNCVICVIWIVFSIQLTNRLKITVFAVISQQLSRFYCKYIYLQNNLTWRLSNGAQCHYIHLYGVKWVHSIHVLIHIFTIRWCKSIWIYLKIYFLSFFVPRNFIHSLKWTYQNVQSVYWNRKECHTENEKQMKWSNDQRMCHFRSQRNTNWFWAKIKQQNCLFICNQIDRFFCYLFRGTIWVLIYLFFFENLKFMTCISMHYKSMTAECVQKLCECVKFERNWWT